MSPAQTTPEALDAFALELQEVEWFGQPAAKPTRITGLGRLLATLGGIAAALLPVLSRS